MCYSLEAFHTYHNIKPIIVKLPNGSQTIGTISETVFFSNQFYLTNILFIPCFTFNLLLVSRLTSTINCKLIFTYKFCEIQDHLTSRMIDVAELKGSLYAMENEKVCFPPNAISYTAINFANLHTSSNSRFFLMTLETRTPIT